MFVRIKMKKLLGILVLGLLLSSNAYAGKNTISLFGIELGSHVNEYKVVHCYGIKEIDENSFTENKLDLNKLKPVDERKWTNLIYTKSKLPVTNGCIEPKIKNDDFFNFEVAIYPKSKEIYEVRAIYKKAFKYSINDLQPSFCAGEKHECMTLISSECNQIANSLAFTIQKTHSKKGFKGGGLPNPDYSSNHTAEMRKGSANNTKYEFEFGASCSIYGNWSGLGIRYFPTSGEIDYERKENYFVGVGVENKDSSRNAYEKMKLKEEMATKGINQEGL